MEKGVFAKAIAAGEWRLKRGGVETYGESISLGLKPRKSDARLIMMALANADSLLIMENIKFIDMKKRKAHQEKVVKPALADVKQERIEGLTPKEYRDECEVNRAESTQS